MTLGEPPVMTLWPPQVSVLADEDASPLKTEVKRAVLTFPTSAGKTLLSQLVIARHLAVAGTGVCFVAPSHSLCREVREGLDRRLWALRKFTVEDGPLVMDCFDGAHLFKFTAELQPDGTLKGDFWSSDRWHETWTAVRDPDAALPDPFGISSWNGEVRLADLAYPDLEGRLRSLDEEAFRGKARILQVFGTWCPNCNDEAPFLAELDRRYRGRGLSILGLAFEHGDDHAYAAGRVRAYAERFGIRFPVLVAGTSDKQAASEAFPLVDRVRAFPTTLFLDRDGEVRAVHTGFSGPATSAEHEKLRADFERLIESLLAEADEETR